MKSALHLMLIIAVCWAEPSFGQDSTLSIARCVLTRKIDEPCRIEWSFPNTNYNSYWVQQFEPVSSSWVTLGSEPEGTTSHGASDKPVEPAYLYRVLACIGDPSSGNCQGSTMVWVPFVQPPERVDLIPSRVIAINPEKGPYVGGIIKDANWLVQVIQYNVYQMVNAISFSDLSKLPDMTPVANLLEAPSSDPLEQIHFNVYAAYLAEQGNPLVVPDIPPLTRKPHTHPERDD